MNPTKKYCIVYKAEGNIEEYYKKITSDLDEKFNIGNISKKIFQHLTLKYHFETDEENISKIIEKVKLFLADKKSFDIQIDGFGRFPANTKTIFLSPVDNPELITFRNGLIKALEDGSEERYQYEYHPHISIARDLTPESFDFVWGYVHTLPNPHFDLTCNNVAIIVKNGEIWSTYELIRF